MNEIKLTKRVKYAGDVFKALTEKAGFPIDLATDFLNNIPDADAVPVVHGRWERFEEISGNIGVSCSVCGWKDYLHGKYKSNLYKYCPNCGARMDGGMEE